MQENQFLKIKTLLPMVQHHLCNLLLVNNTIAILLVLKFHSDLYDVSFTDAVPTIGKLSMMKTVEGKKIKIIQSVASRWQELGDQLEFDEFGAKLDAIKTKNNDPEVCCREMFQHWLKGNGVKPCSWRKLIELLEDCDFDALAEQVNFIFTT